MPSKMERYCVEIDYIGGILSDNSYKFHGSNRTKPMVSLWMKELAGKVKELNIPQAKVYRIGVFGKFTNEVRPDIANLFKVIGDALKGKKGLGIDDKHFRFEDWGYEVGFTEPKLLIYVWEDVRDE